MNIHVPISFQGEEMICAFCGAVQESDPGVESGWERVILDHGLPSEFSRYICPKHLPKPGATAKRCSRIFERNLKRLIQMYHWEMARRS